MNYELVVTALGVLLGVIGWLIKRVMDNFESDIQDLKKETQRLDKRITDHIEKR